MAGSDGAAVAPLGIIGGYGFYELLTGADEVQLDTPYCEPSDALVVGSFEGVPVAFVPRHGRGHRIPPHRVNYRANLWALHEVGVRRVIAPCAVGSLREDLAPGTFVVLDQLVDRTWGRPDTFFDGPGSLGGTATEAVTHVSLADPYCPHLRRLATAALEQTGIAHRNAGTVVVIQGPRFSTRAESRWYSSAGWDVIGMTSYPEAALARELAMCIAGIALVTDYDAGLEDPDAVAPVSAAQVIETFAANVANLRALLAVLVPSVPQERECDCAAALDGAQLGS